MRKIASVLLVLGILAMTTACSDASPDEGSSSPDASRSEPLTASSNSSEPLEASLSSLEPSENIQIIEPPSSQSEEKSNILIAYFTWAENTHVDDPNSVDADATTSASVLMPGNVGLLAYCIEEETGGDRFSIITEEPYSSDYDTCLNRAIEEHDDNIRPAIKGQVDNMEDYDIVFLGFPNWWYSCPMAILTFIEENDLSGKTIIPFCSHGTGGFAASLRDIGNVLPDDCTVLEEFGAYRPEVKESKDELLQWLSALDIEY